MRLNLQSDYALRVLTHLDVRRGELVTIKEIADRFRISQNHLMKVAYLLGREGFIETVRGRSGGLRLIRRSDTIRIGDVVRSMENDLALVEFADEVVERADAPDPGAARGRRHDSAPSRAALDRQPSRPHR